MATFTFAETFSAIFVSYLTKETLFRIVPQVRGIIEGGRYF